MGINNFLNKKFILLDRKQDRYLLIFIVFVFSVVFLNLFVPFNINRWYSDSGFLQFVRLSGYGFVVALVLLFTQFPLRKWFNKQKFKVKYYILWLIIEISLISFVYIFMYGNPVGNFKNDFFYSIRYTSLGICLPYTFALLIIYYKNQQKEIHYLRESTLKSSSEKLISFNDENGKPRFSVLTSKILFLESADNYVYIFYLENGKIKRIILRNTLKNLEEMLNSYSILRCHRSYIVNTMHIESVQKRGKNIYLKLLNSDSPIAVSPKYKKIYSDFFR